MCIRDRRHVGVVVAAAIGLLAAVLWWTLVQSAFTSLMSQLIPIAMRYARPDDFGRVTGAPPALKVRRLSGLLTHDPEQSGFISCAISIACASF